MSNIPLEIYRIAAKISKKFARRDVATTGSKRPEICLLFDNTFYQRDDSFQKKVIDEYFAFVTKNFDTHKYDFTYMPKSSVRNDRDYTILDNLYKYESLCAEVNELVDKANEDSKSSIYSVNPGYIGLDYLQNAANRFNGTFDKRKKRVDFLKDKDFKNAILYLRTTPANRLMFQFLSIYYDNAKCTPDKYDVQ